MVVQLSGSSLSNGYRLRNTDRTWWDNKVHKIIQWSMRYSENVVVYIPVETSEGFRYLQYTTASTDNLGNSTYVHHGLGPMAKDGSWHSFARNLEHDLQEAQPGNTLLSILGFYIRGSGLVGEVYCKKDFPADLDNDGDGISDYEEIFQYGTNPYLSDSDGDGIDDGTELAYWGNQWDGDIDGDGIINLLDNDSDNDGFSDGLELSAGTDPADSTAIVDRIVYEDSEDTNIEGWDIYDNDPAGALISNVEDSERGGRVITFEGDGTANGYRFRNRNGGWWQNGGHKMLEWSMKYSGNFVIYVATQTTEGFRYLYYTPADYDNLGDATYIHHGLTSLAKDGSWHRFARDLEHDLQEAQPGNNLESIQGFLVRGSGYIDDIITSVNFPAGLETDGDNLSDEDELLLYGTSPYTKDTDGDGLDDDAEINFWGTNWNADSDGDGAINLLDFDSDNDGIPDGTENDQGTAADDPTDLPVTLLYEDAEDNTTAGWDVYDNTPEGANFTNVFDEEKNSRVIEFTGDGTANGYRLRDPDGQNWGNGAHGTIHWSMKYNESFVIYIPVQTSDGFRYLYYTSANTDQLGDGQYIHHGLGSEAGDGLWHTFSRDLNADLKDAQPDNEMLQVDGFLIRGSGRVDDIKTVK